MFPELSRVSEAVAGRTTSRWRLRGTLAIVAPFIILLAMPAQAAGSADDTLSSGSSSEPAPAGEAAVEAPEDASRPVAREERFDVWEYRISGDRVLDRRQIEKAVYPFLGPRRTLTDVQGARDALRELYADAGYLTARVSIPEQTVDNGIVKLAVSGFAGEIRASGGSYHRRAVVRDAIRSLEPGDLPNIPALQSELSALNSRSADLSASPALRTGSTPGTLDVDLAIEDSLPLHGALRINNRAIKDTADHRYEVQLGYDNLFQRQHSLQFQYQATFDNQEVKVFSGSYFYRPKRRRDGFLIYAVNNASDISTFDSQSDRTTSVIGKGFLIGGSYIRPLLGGPGRSGSLSLGMSYNDLEDDVRSRTEAGGEQDPTITPIQFIGFDATLSGNFRYGENNRHETFLSAGLRWGVRGLVNEEQQFDDKRQSAQPNYFFLAFDASQRLRLPLDFQLSLDASAQLSDRPLIGPRQFSAGGMRTVRGYFEAERLGDYGIVTRLELRSPQLAGHVPEALDLFGIDDVQGMVFTDYASLGRHIPFFLDLGDEDGGGSEEDRHYALASTGLGFSAASRYGLAAEMILALPLMDADPTEAGDPRFLFNVGVSF